MILLAAGSVPDLGPYGSWLNNAGVITYGVVTIVGGARQWWVFGWIYRQAIDDLKQQLVKMTEERDRWRDLALRNLNVAEKAVDVKKEEGGKLPWD